MAGNNISAVQANTYPSKYAIPLQSPSNAKASVAQPVAKPEESVESQRSASTAGKDQLESVSQSVSQHSAAQSDAAVSAPAAPEASAPSGPMHGMRNFYERLFSVFSSPSVANMDQRVEQSGVAGQYALDPITRYSEAVAEESHAQQGISVSMGATVVSAVTGALLLGGVLSIPFVGQVVAAALVGIAVVSAVAIVLPRVVDLFSARSTLKKIETQIRTEAETDPAKQTHLDRLRDVRAAFRKSKGARGIAWSIGVTTLLSVVGGLAWGGVLSIPIAGQIIGALCFGGAAFSALVGIGGNIWKFLTARSERQALEERVLQSGYSEEVPQSQSVELKTDLAQASMVAPTDTSSVQLPVPSEIEIPSSSMSAQSGGRQSEVSQLSWRSLGEDPNDYDPLTLDPQD